MATLTTPIRLGNNSQSASSATLDVTLSGAIPSGALAFCAVSITRGDTTTPAAPSSVTGGGVTWALETTNQYDVTGTNRGAVFVYRAYATSPSGTTVSIAPGYTCSMAAVVFYTTASAAGNNGGDAFVQEVTATGGAISVGASAAAAAMNTLANTSDNGFILITAGNSSASGRSFAPDTSPAMTELSGSDISAGGASPYAYLQISYLLASSATNPTLSCTAVGGGYDATGVVGYEIGAAVGPTITTQPTAQTALLSNGGTATFTVAATSSGGSLTYDWELETSVGGGVYANVADGSGGTWTGQAAATLNGTFTATTLNGRRVRCNVTDDNGTTTTNAVTLTVKHGPTLSGSGVTNGSGVATRTLVCDYVCGTGEFIALTATAKGRTVRGSARST